MVVAALRRDAAKPVLPTPTGSVARASGIGARRYLERSLEMWREQGQRELPGLTLRLMARIAIDDGQLSVAHACCEQALDAAKQSGERLRSDSP